MESIQVGHLKAEFSTILHRIQENGEMFIIEYGRNHKKIAMLIPYQASLAVENPRVFGVMKNRGTFTLGQDFDITDNEFLGDE
jgi:antitoxin (DNA-binding transcriptional repressor) of toxin-antitoxin stability system